ncbi:MAG: alpha/beta hydrolase [Chlorobi bacterium]|nr:alpha/beta hydrolase [Chlorobiota bacterium]
MNRKIYILPGLGASTDIYRALRFPAGYEIVPVEWIMPRPDESLSAYAKRLVERYRIRPGQVLMGMSFGGMMINEISRLAEPRKMVFISTVKTSEAFPPWFKWGRAVRIWNRLPYGLIVHPLRTARFMPVKVVRKRLLLYERYLSIRDPEYFKWAIRQILFWNRDMPPFPYLHVHGTRDRVFPMKYLKGDVVPVEGAAHLALMTHPHRIGPVVRRFLKVPHLSGVQQRR